MKHILFTASLVALTLPAFAQLDRSQKPEPGPAPEIQLGDYESFTLDNGLQVFVVENNKLPRVAFSLLIDIDPQTEGDKAGYIDLAGQLLKRGTETKSKEELDEAIDFMGASLSTSANSIYASSLSRHTENLLEIMADVLLNPAFPEDELEKLKKQTISGITSSEDDADYILRNVSRVLVYGESHPYGELTTKESVEQVSIEDIKAYYDAYFKPNNAYLAIVGDINKADAEKLIRQHLEKWEQGDVKQTDVPEIKAPEATTVTIVDRPSSVQSNVRVTYPVSLQPGDEDVIKARITNQILGGGASGRLFTNLRETYGYTYGSYSSLSSDKFVGSFAASANVRNEVTDSAVYQMLYELDRISSEPVEEDELQAVKNNVSGSFARSLESPQTVASFAINTARYNLPEDYYQNYLKNVESVTAEDVKATAEKFIKPGNAHIIIVGKAADIEDNLSQFGEIKYADKYGKPKEKNTTAALPDDLTAEEVISAYITAVGGEEQIKKINDLKITSSATIQGTALEILQLMKNDGRYFQSIQAMGMEVSKTVINDEEVAVYQQGQKVPMDEEAMKETALTAGFMPELKFDAYEVATELTGIEDVEGESAYIIEATMPSGSKFKSYYSVDSGLKLRESREVETPQGNMSLSTDFTDYREVEGVMFPYTTSLPLGGNQKLVAEIAEVEINAGVDESKFEIQ